MKDERFPDRRELVTLLALLGVLFVAFQWRLGSVLVTDMDEGTYLYAGKLIGQGQVPYKDFLLAHPPLVALVTCLLYELPGAGVMTVREAHLVLVLLGTLPLYLLARSISRSPTAALLTVASTMTGMLLLSNMGRTVRLEPLMNVFVAAAFAIWGLRPAGWWWRLVLGVLAGAAVCVKVNAVIPLGLLFLADLTVHGSSRALWASWLVAGLGALLVLVPVGAWCLAQPGFVAAVFESQVSRPRVGLTVRGGYLLQNFVRFPLTFVGLIVALIVPFVKGLDSRLRAVAIVAAGNLFLLFFVFKTFFGYYIVQVLPLLALLSSQAAVWAAERWLSRLWISMRWVVLAVLALALPVAYAEVYHRRGAAHVAEPREVIARISQRPGYLYSMYPAFVLWSGREAYPWYYRTDSLVARINGWIGDEDFMRAFDGCTTLVIEPEELASYPRTRALVESKFEPIYTGHHWMAWHRRPGH